MRLLFFPFPIRLSLRPILVIPFVLEIITILGVTGYISHYNGQRAVNNMSYRLRDEVTDRVTEHLTDYFADANKITETTTNALQNNLLKANDFRTISQFLWNQSKLHDVSYINYGLTTGEYIGSGHCLDRQNAMTITEISPETGFKAYNYLTDNSGNHVGKPEIFKYDFRHEPWFNKVVVSKKPMWTEPYVWDNNPNMISMAIGRPVRDRSGQVIGALSVDLSLTRISDFLRNIKISPTGKVVVIDLQGQLVASSGSEVPFKTSEGGVKRLATGDLPEGITKKASDYLTTKFSNFNTIKQKYHGEFFIDGERYFVQVTPWKDPLGLNLLIMVIVPEKDFMGIIRKNAQSTIILSIIALLIGILISIITAKYILKPISETAQAAKAISAGDWNQELPTSSIKELNSLRQSFNTMARQLKKSFQDLEYAAYHDCLTGLPNQCSFRKTLEKTIADNKLTPNLFAVLFLDLDFFKFVNDSLGHLAGDVLLSEVARRLETCVRSNDIIARFGGDEFVILLNNTKSKNDAIAIIIRIQKELQKVFTINGNAVFINTSVGIVFSDLYPMSGEEMLKNADIALYQSKNNGKGMHTIFSKEMSLMSKNRLLLEMDLRQAMERKEIEIFYQPIFSIPEKDIVGFEALMRWRHPELGLIPPDIFIPIAEEIGLINSLGWWVAREACQQLKKWHEQFRECAGMKINVNFSGKQFFESNFIEQIQEILITTRLQPHNLSVEVTESIFIKYTDVMRDKLLELNRIGVKVSLDDFGVGYSCLSYLKDFSIDILKIDRSFTQNLAGNSKIVAIIEAIILLAAKLDVEIIAEGIETEEQLEMIQYLGCCQGQGYLFSRPLEARQCERLLKDFFQPFLNDDQFLPFRHNNQQSHQKANFQNY